MKDIWIGLIWSVVNLSIAYYNWSIHSHFVFGLVLGCNLVMLLVVAKNLELQICIRNEAYLASQGYLSMTDGEQVIELTHILKSYLWAARSKKARQTVINSILVLTNILIALVIIYLLFLGVVATKSLIGELV